jgi:hypothetical protein
MSGRPKPALASPSGWLRNVRPPAAPYPTAGSVIGMTMGRNPYFSSRKPLTSSQPSSAERNFDGAGVVSSGGFSIVICARVGDAQSVSAIRIEIA